MPRGDTRRIPRSARQPVVAGVALALLLFAADLATGDDTVLAVLFGTAALVTAMSGTTAQTFAVGVLATALAVPVVVLESRGNLGQDVVRVLAVVVTGAMATWMAHLRRAAEAYSGRQRMLATTAEALTQTDDVAATLQRIATAVVAEWADVCAVDVLDGDQRLERVAAAHADPAKARALRDLPPVPLAAGGGRRDGDGPPPVPADLAALGIGAVATVPLVSRALTQVGTLTVGRAHDDGELPPADVDAARELARRCAALVQDTRHVREMRDTQRRLLDAFGLLDVLFERAPIGLAFFDAELRYLRINDRMAEINGVSAMDHLGRRATDVAPGIGGGMEDDLRRVLEEGVAVVDVELTGATPSAPAPRDFLVSYFPVRRGGVEVIGVGAVVQDVTDRRAAERALRAQTDRYETLLLALSEVGEGMVVLEDDAVVYANQAFQTMTGYGFEDLRALESVFDLVVPAQRDEARARARLRVERGVADTHVQLGLRHRDGRLLDLEVAGVPLEIEGRQQLVIVVRDVTARRRAERERERLLAAETEARAEAELAHRRARFLAEASVAFEQSLDVGRSAELIASLAVREEASTCVVLLSPAGTLPSVAAVAARGDGRADALRSVFERYPVHEREHPLLTVTRTGGPMVLRDVEPELIARLAMDAGELDRLRAAGGRGRLIIPLRARGRVLGSVALGYDDVLDDARAQDQLRLYEDFCARAALALDNARLYEERTHVARTLQRSLLPSELPDIPGTELAARYLAAGSGNEVGGDFYDAFPLGGGEWALVIGDVCGKGAEAAAITALARYTIRAAVLHTRRPSRVLAELNEALLRHNVDYRFCTVVFAGLQPLSSGRWAVRLASGGHPLPLIIRADGTTDYAGKSGTLLGIVPSPDLPEDEIVLSAGDALVLYTDGVIEASPVDDALGPDAFAALGAGYANAPASAIAQAIQDAVLAVQDGGLRDDVALLVVRILTAGDE